MSENGPADSGKELARKFIPEVLRLTSPARQRVGHLPNKTIDLSTYFVDFTSRELDDCELEWAATLSCVGEEVDSISAKQAARVLRVRNLMFMHLGGSAGPPPYGIDAVELLRDWALDICDDEPEGASSYLWHIAGRVGLYASEIIEPNSTSRMDHVSLGVELALAVTEMYEIVAPPNSELAKYAEGPKRGLEKAFLASHGLTPGEIRQRRNEIAALVHELNRQVEERGVFSVDRGPGRAAYIIEKGRGSKQRIERAVAEHFNVDERTVRRAVKALNDKS